MGEFRNIYASFIYIYVYVEELTGRILREIKAYVKINVATEWFTGIIWGCDGIWWITKIPSILNTCKIACCVHVYLEYLYPVSVCPRISSLSNSSRSIHLSDYIIFDQHVFPCCKVDKWRQRRKCLHSKKLWNSFEMLGKLKTLKKG
jgi:hypothetical protein